MAGGGGTGRGGERAPLGFVFLKPLTTSTCWSPERSLLLRESCWSRHSLLRFHCHSPRRHPRTPAELNRTSRKAISCASSQPSTQTCPAVALPRRKRPFGAAVETGDRRAWRQSW